MVAEIDKWARYPNGNITMHAITGMGVMPVSTGHQILRIEYATNPKQMSQIKAGIAEPEVVQLGLTMEQATKLADMLNNAVTKFEAVSSKGGKAN